MPAASSAPASGSRLPSSPLRADVLRWSALGGLMVIALSVLARYATLAVHPALALATFVTIMAVALTAMASSHPFARFGPANQVTMVRGALLAIVASVIVGPATATTAWAIGVVTAVFAMLDGVDGLLARRSGMPSAFGARFDMEMDALFVLVLSILLWRYDKAGAWALAAGLMRYAFVAAGWVLPWLAQPLRATWRGKTVAVGLMVSYGVAITPLAPSPASRIIAATALTALIWSFAIDVGFLWRRSQGA